MSRNV